MYVPAAAYVYAAVAAACGPTTAVVVPSPKSNVYVSPGLSSVDADASAVTSSGPPPVVGATVRAAVGGLSAGGGADDDEPGGGALGGGEVRGQLGGVPGPLDGVDPPLAGGVDDVEPDEPGPGLVVEPRLIPGLVFDFGAVVSASGGPGLTGGGSGASCGGGLGRDGRIGMVTPGCPDA